MRKRASGFSLVEVMIAIALLAMAGLVLMMAIRCGSQSDRLGRERITANQAIRAYIDYEHETYPTSGGSDMTGFLSDPLTPVDFLPKVVSGTTATFDVASSAIHDIPLQAPSGLVLKETDETGANWGPVAKTASGAVYSPGSSTTGSGSTYTCSGPYAPVAWSWSTASMATTASVSSAVPTADAYLGNVKTCLGCAQDLNGNGSSTETAPSSIQLVPTQITITWQSPENPSTTDIQRRQRITVYASFSIQR